MRADKQVVYLQSHINRGIIKAQWLDCIDQPRSRYLDALKAISDVCNPQELLLKSCFPHNQKQLSESRETDHYGESYLSYELYGACYIHYYITATQQVSPLFLSLLSFHPTIRTILHIIKIFCHSFSVETFPLSSSSEDAKSNFCLLLV